MDIARIKHLAGIISESADVTKAIKDDKLKTKNAGEAISNQIEQGKNGEVKVADTAKPEEKPTVPKDVPQKKAIGLKEAYAQAMQASRASVNPNPGIDADALAAYHDWKAECRQKDPRCTFTGTKEGTEAVNWDSVRPRAVGKWNKFTKEGTVF